MEKLLSIIVPVYKVEAYINKCLDSLVMDDIELMEKLEVIIVNDGTPDRSAEMSREYVKRYPGTFRQIDKENGGHGSAWNVGLSEASGKYIRFLDSDDWFTNLERLIKDIDISDADIIFNPFIKEFIIDGKAETVIPPQSHLPLSKIESCIWGQSKWGFNSIGFWGCTYKSSILLPLYPLFAEKTMYDDSILSWAPLVYGRTYLSLDYPVYHYLLGRPGQTMSMTQHRKGAISYCKCIKQYEIIRSRIDATQIPQDLLSCIDSSFSSYALLIFPSMVYLPYSEAKVKMRYLWNKYLASYPRKTHLSIRFEKLPFVLFYFIEQLRIKLLKR